MTINSAPRPRPALADERLRMHAAPRARALPPAAVLQEAALAFGAAFVAPLRSRFLGAHFAPREREVNTVFLATHFVVRHREALLWSCGAGAGWVRTGKATRTTARDLENNLRKAESRAPCVVDPWTKMSTTYSWVSMDRYSPTWRSLAPAVRMARDECLGADGERAWDTFRRLVMEDLECGDHGALVHAVAS
ncbi:hypothetical protein GGX14DRAFT_643568 [Mycena pura]|uniref:Uncharacterized protein n=1 Tax=Mycena pura TaxID=153505 RepID=A0AAD6V9A1_9AGAR|nr:hypothetical protein GGX14DRAFT_643568 [Mycena pura]